MNLSVQSMLVSVRHRQCDGAEMTAPASPATKLAKLLRLNTKEQLPLCLNTAAQTKTDDGGAAAAINTSSSQMLNLSKEIITGRRYKRRKI